MTIDEKILFVETVLADVNSILSYHSKEMCQQGANVYFAYQNLNRAKDYLERELGLLREWKKRGAT